MFNNLSANLRNFDGGLSLTAEGDFQIITIGAENLRVNSANGYVGIGNPATLPSMLTVNGGATISALTTGQILFPTSGGTLSGTNSLFWDNATDSLRIGSNTSANRRLSIFSSSDANHFALISNAPAITLSNNFSYTYYATLGMATANNNFVAGTVAGDLVLGAFNTNSIIFSNANTNTQRMKLTSGGDLVIGATSADTKLDVRGEISLSYSASNGLRFYNQDRSNWSSIGNDTATGTSNANLVFRTSAGTALTIAANRNTTFATAATFSSSVTIGGNGVVQNGNVLSVYRTDNTRAIQLYTTNDECVLESWQASSEPLHIRSFGSGGRIQFFTNANERMRITSSGNVGIGTSSPDTALTLQFNKSTRFAGQSIYDSQSYNVSNQGGTISFGGRWNSGGSITEWAAVGGVKSNTTDGDYSGDLTFYTRPNSSGMIERMRITSGGNVLINTTTDAGYELYVNGGSTNGALFYSTSAANQIKAAGTAPAITFTNTITSPTIGGVLGAATTANQFVTGTVAGDVALINQYTGALVFGTVTERMRISSGGNVAIGRTDDRGYRLSVQNVNATPINVNRTQSDGGLIDFEQDGALEGNISVSGNTVSYNSFLGSHWSQLQDGSKTEILKGTILEAIDEMCIWEGETNDRLPKSKISDTINSKNVYGVFLAWDENWKTSNDFYVAAVGLGYIRVNSSQNISMGDLLQSNGDGTAKIQEDDIMRSSTIAKVVSTNKITIYEDGSYLIAAGYGLIKMFQASTEATAKNESAVKKNDAALKQQIKSSEKASEALKTKNGHEYEMAKASGASTKALRALALKHAEEEIALNKASLATAKNTYEKNKNTLASLINSGASDELIEKQREITVESRKASAEERKDLEEALKNKKDIIRKNAVEVQQEITDKNTKLKESNKTHNDAIKQQNEEAAKVELDRIKTLKESILALDEEIRVSKLTDEQKEVDAIDKKYTKLIEEGKKAKIDVLTLEEEKRLALAAITKKYDDADASIRLTNSQTVISEMVTAGTKRLEGEKATSEKSIEIAKEEKEKKAALLQQQLDLVKGSFQAFADVATLFAGKNKKAQKTAFNIQKAANIASATIDTYTAATAAFKSAVGIPVVGPVLAPIAVSPAGIYGFTVPKPTPSASRPH